MLHLFIFFGQFFLRSQWDGPGRQSETSHAFGNGVAVVTFCRPLNGYRSRAITTFFTATDLVGAVRAIGSVRRIFLQGPLTGILSTSFGKVRITQWKRVGFLTVLEVFRNVIGRSSRGLFGVIAVSIC